MKHTGLFYATEMGNTEQAAHQIMKKLGPEQVSMHNLRHFISAGTFTQYTNYILGVSTWGAGDLHQDWADMLERLNGADLSDKTVAMFALGDQMAYPDMFVNGMGALYEFLKSHGATIIGQWPTDSYQFDASTAIVDGHFAGLVLDQDNQPEMTESRLNEWLNQVAPAMGLTMPKE